MPGIFVITGPSGVGKTTVADEILKSLDSVKRVVTHTTRASRPGEIHGEHYFFVSRDEFSQKIQNGDMFEHAEVYGNLYGSTKESLRAVLNSGKHVLFGVDVQGAIAIKEENPDCKVIMIHPPSLDELRKRIENRGDTAQVDVEKRLNVAKSELDKQHLFDYKITNALVADAVSQVKEIIDKESF